MGTGSVRGPRDSFEILTSGKNAGTPSSDGPSWRSRSRLVRRLAGQCQCRAYFDIAVADDASARKALSSTDSIRLPVECDSAPWIRRKRERAMCTAAPKSRPARRSARSPGFVQVSCSRSLIQLRRAGMCRIASPPTASLRAEKPRPAAIMDTIGVWGWRWLRFLRIMSCAMLCSAEA